MTRFRDWDGQTRQDDRTSVFRPKQKLGDRAERGDASRDSLSAPREIADEQGLR